VNCAAEADSDDDLPVYCRTAYRWTVLRRLTVMMMTSMSTVTWWNTAYRDHSTTRWSSVLDTATLVRTSSPAVMVWCMQHTPLLTW